VQLIKIAGWHDADGLRTYISPAPDRSAEQRPAALNSGVLMLPMITGIGSQVRDWADEVAMTLGATVLAWDPWHGVSSDDTPLDDLRDRLGRLDDATALDEIRRIVDHMQDRLGLTQISVIGWCLGGRYALLAGARDARLAGVVAMHPTLPASEVGRGGFDAAAAASDIPAPVMVHYPGLDHIVPVESFQRLQSALESRPDAASFLAVHPRAHHGFSDRKNHLEPANAAAFRLSWPQVLVFLESVQDAPDDLHSRSKGNSNA
jgi:carboxymethylenebutenolidase